MQTPSAKFFCPRCRASFDHDTPFCGQCGADMKRASRLQSASAQRDESAAYRAVNAPIQERRGTDPWLGKLVDSRYKVEEVIGRGGMGVVYKVKHQRMGKVAAMKVLHREMADDPEVIFRFEREAKAVSRLAHPNTVQVFDFGRSNDALYLVMEYVRGLDLGAIIDRDGPMSFADAAPLLGQICGSLEEAHHLGIVHRDLKPENLLVSRTHAGQDFVKVLDFGLAKLSERDESSSSKTSAGSIVGTPYYMSPEQIRAEEEVDQRADIYSLGALMYKLFTADNAFNAGSPVGVLTKHLTEALELPSKRYPELSLPKEIDPIIAKCMAKQPNDRYATVRELLEDIEQLYGDLALSSSDSRKNPKSWLASPSGATAPVAALMAEDIDYGMDAAMRLRREDLNDFEKRIRRTRRTRIFGLPLLLLALAGAAAWFFLLRPEAVLEVEQEGNDSLEQANLVALDTKISGFIGKRISKNKADSDFFRFSRSPQVDGSEVVSILVTAPPNIDIRLGLYERSGRLLTHSDLGGEGESEEIRRWRVRKPFIVQVEGVLGDTEHMLPTENVSDPYSLKVSIAPVDPRLESEPNDSAADANEISLGTPVTGVLSDDGDIDVFRIIEAGAYKLLISGGPDKPFEWRIDDGKWRQDFKATFEAKDGSSFQLRYAGTKGPKTKREKEDGGEESSHLAPYTIDLSAG